MLKVFLKNSALIIAVLLIALVSIDGLSYAFISANGLSFFPQYKKNRFQEQLNEAVHYFPRGYNVADPVMGFDTQKNASPVAFNMADGSFEIFSNELGCFDHHTLAEIKAAKEYDYFAGDSFTWGYGNYAQNIPSVYEKKSGRFSVKCGIIHSGQQHQFEKFQRTVKLIGSYPKRVILGFYENDVANDFAYPHTSVIEGYEVDTLRFDPQRFQLVPRDMEAVRKVILAGLNPKSQSWNVRTDAWLEKYSLSWNLIQFGIQKAKPQALSTIYAISEGVSYYKGKGYESAEVTKKNRTAIERWIEDAKTHHYELIMVLIPPKLHHGNTQFYGGLRDYLDSKQVRFIDLTEPFHESGLRSEKLYWMNDGHLHNEGNVFVGEYLAKTIGGANAKSNKKLN